MRVIAVCLVAMLVGIDTAYLDGAGLIHWALHYGAAFGTGLYAAELDFRLYKRAERKPR